MQTKLKLAALGATALLAMVAISAVLLMPGAAGEDGGAELTVTDDAVAMEGTHNLTVTVMGKVDGRMAPLEGAEVRVYAVNISHEDNRTTVAVELVAEGVTDGNGNCSFSLEVRKYCVMAQHGEVVGFAKCNLAEGDDARVIMHQWKADCEHGNAWKKLLARHIAQGDERHEAA